MALYVLYAVLQLSQVGCSKISAAFLFFAADMSAKGATVIMGNEFQEVPCHTGLHSACLLIQASSTAWHSFNVACLLSAVCV